MEENITIYTLAKELNMTPTDVSRAFKPGSPVSEKKRKLILAKAAAHGFVPNKSAARLSLKKITIGVFIRGRIPEFYNEYKEGISYISHSLSDYKVSCDMRIIPESEYSLEKCFSILDEFADNSYDGMIVSGVYNLALNDKLAQFKQKGIPTVLLGYDMEGSPRLTATVNNASAAAYLAADMLSTLISTKNKKILLFTGNMDSPFHRTLTAEFQNAAVHFNLELLDIYDTKDDPVAAKLVAKEALNKHSQVDGIYISSANSVQILQYISSLGLSGSIRIITSDRFEGLRSFLLSGTVSATIYQDPYWQAINAFEKLYEHISYGLVIPSIITATPTIILRSNWDLYGHHN